MTEAEWLACTNSTPMLDFLQWKASGRKIRFFLVTCARRVLPASPDVKITEALAVAERFADGKESSNRLKRIHYALSARYPGCLDLLPSRFSRHVHAIPAWHATQEQLFRAAYKGSWFCAGESARIGFGSFEGMEYVHDEQAAQACLLRDLFGPLPFRPVSPDPAWLQWNNGTVPKIAQAIYDERQLPSGHLDPSRLAILADALEEAGCDQPDLLNHLRGSGPHVRGCWAVDLLLGKE
jgi:hypothetical protein